MSQDNKVISYLSPAEMVALMGETGKITVQESTMADGRPVIHAALQVVNAQTGEQLPGGLPFSVVMFKDARQPGYSNIAIGTIVPTAELDITLPHDYFNFCNQRFRFTRAFPLDERSFVLQMDLFVRNATREYVKYSFGVWASLFSQVLFELMGRGKESLVAAAEAYAARTDLKQQVVSTVTASDEPAAEETAIEPAPEIAAAGEAPVDDAETAATAETKSEEPAGETPVEGISSEKAADTPASEAPDAAKADQANSPVVEAVKTEAPLAEVAVEKAIEESKEAVAA